MSLGFQLTISIAIQIAKAAVLVTVGAALLILLREEEQGHAFATELLMSKGPVGHNPRYVHDGKPGEQKPLQSTVVHVVGQRPSKICLLGSSQIFGDGATRQFQTESDLAGRKAAFPMES